MLQEDLPNIDISISVDKRTFIDDIADHAEASGKFAVERHYDVLGDKGFHGINLRPVGNELSFQIGTQLIVHPDKVSRVLIEIRGWPSRAAPTREEYCSVAKRLIGPILKLYNQRHGSRYRLRIEQKRKAFKLPPTANKLFSRFCLLANKSSLHALDWQRFYDFVYLSRTEIPEGAMRFLLLEAGFSRAYASHVTEIYLHLWAFKRRGR